MKQKGNTILWIIAVCVVFVAAYTIYAKYKPQGGIQQQIPQMASLENNTSALTENTSTAELTIPKDNPTATTKAEETQKPSETQKSQTTKEPEVKEEPVKEEKSTTKESTPQEKEKVMAPDFTLKDMEGKDVTLSSYRGKIVILNFWAVWCKYCKEEMPDLNELNETLKKENDAVILAVDVQESKDTVESYLDKNKISLQVVLDSDGAVTGTYGVTGFPTTFVLNRDGSLFTYISGATNKETLLDILSKMK